MCEMTTIMASVSMESVKNTHELATAQRDEVRGFTDADFANFLRYMQVSPATEATYTRAIRQLVSFLSERGRIVMVDDTFVVQATRDDIIEYKEHLLATGHKPTTVQNYLAAARSFFGWLDSEGICSNACAHVKAPRLDKTNKRDYLTATQMREILATIDTHTLKGKRDYAMLFLMADAGLRCIEVSRANVGDLRPLGGCTVLYVQGKGHVEKGQYVKVPADVETALRCYLKARGSLTDDAPLFASTSNNNDGQRMTTRSISGTVKTRMQAAGYDSERLTAHSLRHTAVTLSLLNGQSLEETKRYARHASMDTTLIYSHAIDDMSNQCAEVVARAILGY